VTTYPTESSAQTGGQYMQNLDSIGEFLMSNGFSQAAAAGVAGTIAGESNGNPESVEAGGGGGEGILQWTPGSSASPMQPILTGNAQQDFDNQLVDMLSYANSNSTEAVQRGGVDLSQLKNATNPIQAASWWSAFEGPLTPGSDVNSNVANSVYQNLNGYKPSGGFTVPQATLDASTSSGAGLLAGSGSGDCIGVTLPVIGCVGLSAGGLEGDIEQILERAGLFILGGIFVIMGLYILVKDTGNGSGSNSGAAATQAGQSAVTSTAEDAAVAA
jgi:Phage tail lysozyme